MKGFCPLHLSCLRLKRGCLERKLGMGRAGGDIVGVFPRVAVPCLPLGCRHLRCDMRGVHLWAPQGGNPARPGLRKLLWFLG